MAKSKDQLLTKIDKLIVEVNAQYAELKSNSELEGIEIALLTSNIEYLAAQVKALQFFVEHRAIIAESSKTTSYFTPASSLTKEVDEQEIFDEIVEQPTVVAYENSVAEVSPIYVEPNVEEVVQEIAAEIEVEPTVVASEPTVANVSATPIVEEVKESVIVNETAAAPVVEEEPTRPLTINELIQQQKQAGVNLTQQFQTSTAQDRVVDLKSAISLNDKLLFIKDLFNGYSLAYSEALELLNRFDSYAEADAFLQSNYALKNGWSERPQTVDKFYVLLRRKFNT